MVDGEQFFAESHIAPILPTHLKQGIGDLAQ
jgi:hypothetical protein